MLAQIWEIVVKWWVELVLSGAVAGIVALWRRHKAVENGVQCLLRSDIIQMTEKYLEKGFCPCHVKTTLEKMYKSYSALKGNDVAKEQYEQAMALPSEPKGVK